MLTEEYVTKIKKLYKVLKTQIKMGRKVCQLAKLTKNLRQKILLITSYLLLLIEFFFNLLK